MNDQGEDVGRNFGVCVRRVPGKGRGVFAERRFAKDEVIERVPVLVASAAEVAHLDETQLAHYTYVWSGQTEAITFGYGLLYNHSYRPNAVYVRRMEAHLIDYIALRDIDLGEEVTVNYGGDPSSTDAVWFEVVE